MPNKFHQERNATLDSGVIIEPLARHALAEAAMGEQTILLAMDQTEIGDRFAILMISVRTGDRSLPVAWCVGRVRPTSALRDNRNCWNACVRACPRAPA